MRRGLAIALAVGAAALWWGWRGGPGPAESDEGRASAARERTGDAATPAGAARAPAPDAQVDPARLPDLLAGAVMRVLGGAPPLDPALLPEMIDRARDPALELRERSRAMRWLAQIGGAEALDVLDRLVRPDEPAGVRAAALGSLGDCSEPLCLGWLETALGSPEPAIAAAAVRGLGRRGDEPAQVLLRRLALDPDAPASLRSSAAAALGAGSENLATLREVLARARADGAIEPDLLEALARQPHSETGSLFRALLADPELDAETRLAAVEALGEAPPEAGDLLAELAAASGDPDLRAAAVESLGQLADDPAALRSLGGLLAAEGDPAVRAEIYQALAFHGSDAAREIPTGLLLERALAERSTTGRLAGYRMVASLLHRSEQPALTRPFDRDMVPWLRQAAESGPDRATRQLSIDALEMAGTAGARDALLDLTHSTDPQVASSAERALRFAGR